MIIGSKAKLKHLPPTVLKLKGEDIEFVNEFKYLGIVIDQNLCFNEHVGYVKRNVYANMQALGCIHQFISQKCQLGYTKAPYADILIMVRQCMMPPVITDSQKVQVILNHCLQIRCKEGLETTNLDVYKNAICHF